MKLFRNYKETDVLEARRLIVDTYREFNQPFASLKNQIVILKPFPNAHSSNAEYKDAITENL
jgi:hypothetical protein